MSGNKAQTKYFLQNHSLRVKQDSAGNKTLYSWTLLDETHLCYQAERMHVPTLFPGRLLACRLHDNQSQT